MKTFVCMFFAAILLLQMSIAKAVDPDLNIAKKTNIGPIQYLFTDEAVSPSNNQGMQFERALRLVPRTLIMGLTKAAQSTEGFQSYVVNKLGVGADGYLELSGFVVAGELYYLSDTNPVVEEFMSTLTRNNVLITGNVVSHKK